MLTLPRPGHGLPPDSLFDDEDELRNQVEADEGARQMVVADVSELGPAGQVRLAKSVRARMVAFGSSFQAISSRVLKAGASQNDRMRLCLDREAAAELNRALDRAVAEGGGSRTSLSKLSDMCVARADDSKSLANMRRIARDVVGVILEHLRDAGVGASQG
jgi:hypothetical protein